MDRLKVEGFYGFSAFYHGEQGQGNSVGSGERSEWAVSLCLNKNGLISKYTRSEENIVSPSAKILFPTNMPHHSYTRFCHLTNSRFHSGQPIICRRLYEIPQASARQA